MASEFVSFSKIEMASELEGGVPKLPTSLDPPLQFRSPPWFRIPPWFRNLQERCPGKICWHHYEICEKVERDMRSLRRQSQPQTAEEEEEEESKIMKMKTIEYEDRNVKIAAFMKETQEADKKRKHKKRKYTKQRCSQRLKNQQWKSEEEEEEVKVNPFAFKLTEYDRIKEWTFEEGKKYEISELLSGGRITRSSRKYLINNKGDKVPTSELDGKTVGLYFFEPTSRGFKWARQLLKVWESLNDEKRNAFVIVFINKDPYNLSNAKAEFKKKFRFAIPWYSVAICGRKLCRVFNKLFSSSDGISGDLVVLRPDCYQHLSYFAYDILVEFGSEAYPFTLENAVKIEKSEQQNELPLGKLLSPEAPLRRGGSTCHKEDSDTTVSKLLGKRVLLLFATHCCYESGSFLVELKRMYEKKRTDDDFEIIYISLDCDESPSSFPESVQEMPWLVHAFEAEFAFALVQQVFDVFPPRLPAIAAFGPDGHLETKESNLAFKNNSNSNSKYPFIEGNLDVEVHRELIHYYEWDLDRIIASDFSFTN